MYINLQRDAGGNEVRIEIRNEEVINETLMLLREIK